MSGSHRSRSLLLVSYFYPPTRDTGAQRPAAMAKWLARSGWDVTVLTTSAFGDAEPAEPAAGDDPAIRVIRSRDLQTVRARLAGHSRVDSLFDSDSYSGKPHPLSKLIVPEPLAVAWTPFARRAALAAHREHPFDCVLTTSPPESAHTIGHALPPPRRPLGRRRPRRLDLRAAAARLPDRAPAPPRRAARAAPARRRRSGRLRQRARRRRPARSRDRRSARDRERLGPRRRSRPPTPHRRRRACSTRPHLAALHRPLRQLRPRPCPARRGARALARSAPEAGRTARAGDRRARFSPASGRCSSAPSCSRSKVTLLGSLERETHPGPAAHRRRPAPARPAGPLPARQLQALRVPGRGRPDPRPRRRDRGGPARRRRRHRPDRRRRRSRGDRHRPRRAARRRARAARIPPPPARFSYPAAAEAMSTASTKR